MIGQLIHTFIVIINNIVLGVVTIILIINKNYNLK